MNTEILDFLFREEHDDPITVMLDNNEMVGGKYHLNGVRITFVHNKVSNQIWINADQYARANGFESITEAMGCDEFMDAVREIGSRQGFFPHRIFEDENGNTKAHLFVFK